MKIISFILILSLAIFISACTSSSGLTYSQVDKVKSGFNTKSESNLYIDYGYLAKEAVTSILKKVKMPNTVIVTDFVDITSLDNNSRLGYVLSNSIKDTIINHYDVNVIEAEVSKYFKISGNGLKILSRDTKKLRATNFKVQFAVVGTYTYSDTELVIFVKLIDLKTGLIKGSYAKSFQMGSGTRMMLKTK